MATCSSTIEMEIIGIGTKYSLKILSFIAKLLKINLIPCVIGSDFYKRLQLEDLK